MNENYRRVKSLSEYCLGCGLCRLACRVAHSPYPEDIIRAMKTGEKPVPRLYIEETLDGCDYRTVRCQHCEEPECIKVCIGGALRKDPETGTVFLDQDRCVGCFSCVLACPHGAVAGPDSGFGKAFKCDLCQGLASPACVGLCPNAALIVVDIREEEV
ncbi:MAG: 4Fe-4S dicluster domain-containing protein [Solirubrobacterales bacterium]